MFAVIGSILTFPFRLIASIVAFCGRALAVIIGFILMAVGVAFCLSTIYILGLPIFIVGLLIAMKSLG